MPDELRYYRFYFYSPNGEGRYGAVFALCNKHCHLQRIPSNCNLQEVHLHIKPTSMECSFCEDEKWLKENAK